MSAKYTGYRELVRVRDTRAVSREADRTGTIDELWYSQYCPTALPAPRPRTATIAVCRAPRGIPAGSPTRYRQAAYRPGDARARTTARGGGRPPPPHPPVPLPPGRGRRGPAAS